MLAVQYILNEMCGLPASVACVLMFLLLSKDKHSTQMNLKTAWLCRGRARDGNGHKHAQHPVQGLLHRQHSLGRAADLIRRLHCVCAFEGELSWMNG